MSFPTEASPNGFMSPKGAELWHSHITEAGDLFRQSPGGLYDQIGKWVEVNGLGHGNRIIDICCGQGVTSQIASDKSRAWVTGVDISGPLIQIANTYYSSNEYLSFQEGDASRLSNILTGEYDAGMMINGIFHLPPPAMVQAVAEISRVSQGPILITTVNPYANEFFSSAFANQTRMAVDEHHQHGPTTVVLGDPSIAGPNGSKIVLTNTPFYWHPMKKMVEAFKKASLEIYAINTFGPTSLVGGPSNLDLFTAIQLKHTAS